MSFFIRVVSDVRGVVAAGSPMSLWRRAKRALVHGSTDISDAATPADIPTAQLRSLVRRTVRVTPNGASGKHVSPKGQRCDVERLPYYGEITLFSPSRAHWDFDLPVAVSLLMRFWLLAALTLLGIFILTTPQMMDNHRRNSMRNECRRALPESYDNIVTYREWRHKKNSKGSSGPEKDAARKVNTETRGALSSSDPKSRPPPKQSKPPKGKRALQATSPGGAAGGPGDDGGPGGPEESSSATSTNPSSTPGSTSSTPEMKMWKDDKEKALHDDCGYSALPIRENISLLDASLLFATGTCEEYANLTDWIQVPPFVGREQAYPFIATPLARFCTRDVDRRELGEWGHSLGATVLMLGLLIALRRMQRVSSRARDRAVTSAADFSVMVHGLPRGVHPEMEGSLLTELRTLGLDAARDVVRIEVARCCSREVEVLDRLAPLARALDEAKVRTELRKARIVSHHARVTALRTAQDAARAELTALADTVHATTGHAIITLQTKQLRNRLLQVCTQMAAAQAARRGVRAMVHPSYRTGLMVAPSLAPSAAAAPSKTSMSSLGSSLGSNGCGAVSGESSSKDVSGDSAAPALRPSVAEGVATPLLSHASVSVAPDPSELLWPNMERTPAYRRRRLAITYSIVLLLVVANGAISVFLKLYSVSQQSQASSNSTSTSSSVVSNMINTESQSSAINAIASSGVALCVTIINYVTKLLLRPLTHREGHATAASFEKSAFNKLALAYLLNTVLVPIIVFVFPFSITQAWYETGGVASAAIGLVAFDALGYTLRIIQIPPLFQRYILAPLTATSQAKLDALWSPSPMFIGELHANALKTVAICLVYSPLYPPCYLLSALDCLWAFVACKYALCFWWGRPPHMTDELMHRLRTGLALLMLVHYGVALAASAKVVSQMDARGQYWTNALARCGICMGLWALYAFAPLSKIPWLKRYTGEEAEDLTGSKDGDATLRYEDVPHEVALYECPALGGPRNVTASHLETLRTGPQWKLWRGTA